MTTNDARSSGNPPGSLSAVIVLAAGAGTRMKSRTPKILHPVGGISMLGHALAAAQELHPRFLAVVVRHERDMVAAHAAAHAPAAVIVDQDEIPGTGRAVQVALSQLDAAAGLEGTVVVTYGDAPLLEAQTLRNLVAVHETDGNAVTVLTARLADPTGYGRVLRAEDGTVTGIVEHKDATDEQRAVREINSGIYAFDAAVLRSALASVTTSNSQGEMYLTDVLGIARSAGGRISAVATDDTWQVEGANDRVQLAALNAEHNRRNLDKWMRAGVTVVDPSTTWIDSTVTLAEDVTILPGTQLHGATTIARDAVVGPDTTLTDVSVGEGASVVRTHGSNAVLGAGSSVGPFAYLRPGTVLGADGKIGTFVETKNANIGAGSKVPHLSYVGDATIGEQSNIGAASVFVNYDGVNKHHTTIGSHVRMGSDNMYVAPVTVGDGAYSGAGTVVRKDVPAGSLAINVAPQRNLDGWVLTNRPGTAAADAAAAANASATATDSTTSSADTDSPTRESDH
ncbi:bifunctional UDP-N-acetylglucosamine diphosphorylase/glucosamine-1-phosphate N-acetyltransferase GlmU [Arthrobacter sp. zg-Y877]|uniref:bifunctional UDP-N-acetylglucosamine diphosphorylase/glucosamine-1-phosphate N-acetyltransferase GlmU n=1 Tax=Arthrobacter sp. zg-Y877 TaxID=3049074 RepID=UPI0025A46A4F|nr:bifunctional UDP-N-acetylglucosamine diphosphorylase/glucosamine-1-phosphate N-acetyltransferase GlmU [Arthrobacter sp. zg-Y877]MDM7990501.1 bifunctional UDP-N-acetylglucosamine diphosphorylase/glucosamine-1-phosphate N-acetyltransferase GlmU [Arthrobacter sp. zg-Y877]